jgi:hypothetical protein
VIPSLIRNSLTATAIAPTAAVSAAGILRPAYAQTAHRARINVASTDGSSAVHHASVAG